MRDPPASWCRGNTARASGRTVDGPSAGGPSRADAVPVESGAPSAGSLIGTCLAAEVHRLDRPAAARRPPTLQASSGCSGIRSLQSGIAVGDAPERQRPGQRPRRPASKDTGSRRARRAGTSGTGTWVLRSILPVPLRRERRGAEQEQDRRARLRSRWRRCDPLRAPASASSVRWRPGCPRRRRRHPQARGSAASPLHEKRR